MMYMKNTVLIDRKKYEKLLKGSFPQKHRFTHSDEKLRDLALQLLNQATLEEDRGEHKCYYHSPELGKKLYAKPTPEPEEVTGHIWNYPESLKHKPKSPKVPEPFKSGQAERSISWLVDKVLELMVKQNETISYLKEKEDYG